MSQEINTNEPVQGLYWGKPKVVFTHESISAALIRMDFVQIHSRNKTIPELYERAKARAEQQRREKEIMESIGSMFTDSGAGQNITLADLGKLIEHNKEKGQP